MMKNTMLEMSRYAALARQAVAERLYLGTRNFTTTKAAQGPAGW